MELPITRDAVRIQTSRAATDHKANISSGLESAAGSELGASLITNGHADSEAEAAYKTHRRFDRAARLFSEPGLHRLMRSRVLVIGVGGVGSFTAEALARSAVGQVDLVDFDRVCVTNTNRQLHAMQGTIGQRKVDIMAARLALIHPTGKFAAVAEFYNAENRDKILQGKIDFVVDAIDNLSAKADLLATCLARKIPVVSSMGAAARMDPTQVRVADLADTYKDPFAAALRKILRKEHGLEIEAGRPLGVTAVFSPEEAILPAPPNYDAGQGFRCVCPGGKNGLHDCDRRARIDGTASFVTGAFGLAAASVVVKQLIHTEFHAAERHNAGPRDR